MPSIAIRIVFLDKLESSLYQNEKHYKFNHGANLVSNPVMVDSAHDRNKY